MEFIKKLKFKGLIVVVFIAAVIRLVGLGSVPYGFANDEVSYILSGYEIAQTGGFDIAGKFLPFSVNLDSSLSPVPVYLISIFVKLFTLSPFISRLPFALLGIGSVVLVYFISKELFKKEGIAFAASIVIALSSWHILVTRGVWDVVPAQFFYLLGLFIFLKNLKKGSILWSLPAFLLGFFSYHGTKVFFVFFIVLLFALFWKQLVKRKKEFALFSLGILMIFAIFALVLKTQSVTRQEEIIFTNKAVMLDAKKVVDFERTKSNAPLILQTIVSNKVTYFIQRMVDNYLGAFSLQYLVTTGDINPIVGYGAFFRGVIYFIDIPFLMIGFIYLLFKVKNITRNKSVDQSLDYRTGFILIFISLLISPLPSVFGAGTTYVIRGFMMAPFLSIFIGIGLYAIWQSLEGVEKYKIVGRISIVLIYAIFVSRFLYQYYYQFNSYGSEYWNKSSRELSEYIVVNNEKFNRVIISTSEDKVIFQYAMVSHADPQELKVAWLKNWPVILGKVTFINSCYKDGELENKLKAKTLYVVHSDCHTTRIPQKKIVDPLEPLRIIWKLYEN